MSGGYLDGVPDDLAAQLRQANEPGLVALRHHLRDRQAIAFLGAGASAPLYPLWNQLITDLIDGAVERGLPDTVAATCRAEAASRPEAVVDLISTHLGQSRYLALLRELFQVRRDPQTGDTWTPVHELVCRCPFKAVVTTNYDPGIVDARIHVRRHAVSTSFYTWQNELHLDDWRTGDIFGGDELPVLYAHGYHNQPEGIVLALGDYHRAYAGKLSRVIGTMVDAGHLVWLGFSFNDQRIAAILREVAEHTGTRERPGAALRHVVVAAFDPSGSSDPAVLAELARHQFGADLVLYPAPGGDHSALQRLLADFVDPAYPPVAARDAPPAPPIPALPTAVPPTAPVPVKVTWAQGAEGSRLFVGRGDELAKLDRWAADPTVRIVGVTAWGGAGKTALVTHWLDGGGVDGRRAAFAWSFYADPSADHWAAAVLDWAARTLGVVAVGPDLAARVVDLLRQEPVVLVLDGLEVIQESPGGGGTFGRFLDGTLRQVLTGAALVRHHSLVVLTSRFPFADLASFDGSTARMIELPPFTTAEGADLLTAAGVTDLSPQQLAALAASVDGHALALTALAALLTTHAQPVADLLSHLAEAGATGQRVSRLLAYYADRLDQAQQLLVAAVGLFTRPITPAQLLALTRSETFQPLADWDEAQVRAAVLGPLRGLLTWHTNGTITAHPLVRQAFRKLALGGAQVAVDVALEGTPTGAVTDRDQALRVVEAIELLLDAGQWQAADDLFQARTDGGYALSRLPAARLGLRAATAFAGTPARRQAAIAALGERRTGFYVNEIGLFAMITGEQATALEFLALRVDQCRAAGDSLNLAITLQNWSGLLIGLGRAHEAAEAAAEALALALDGSLGAYSHASLATATHLVGDTATAEVHFGEADRLTLSSNRHHPASYRGALWGIFLTGTGRPAAARHLAEAGLTASLSEKRNQSAARHRAVLARLDLGAAATDSAREHVEAALRTFRAGDMLVDLAAALVVAGEIARVAGHLDEADDHLTEAVGLAGPHELRPTLSAAHAARARVFADRLAATHDADQLTRGRDAADAALRLARSPEPLPWAELDAFRAHAALDRAEGIDRTWARQAADLHAHLVPPGLDPDPLATIEADVKTQREREEAKAADGRAARHPWWRRLFGGGRG